MFSRVEVEAMDCPVQSRNMNLSYLLLNDCGEMGAGVIVHDGETGHDKFRIRKLKWFQDFVNAAVHRQTSSPLLSPASINTKSILASKEIPIHTTKNSLLK